MAGRRRRFRWRFVLVALLVALLLHAVLFVSGWYVINRWGLGGDKSYRVHEFNVNIEETIPKPGETPRPDHQIVTITPPKHEQKPSKARFFSEFDSKVKRESKAPGRKATKVLTQESAHRVGSGRRGPSGPPAPSSNPNQGTATVPPSPLAMRPGRQTRPGLEAPRRPGENRPKGGRVGHRLTRKNLALSDRALASAIGSAFPDALKNVPEGAKTLLDTKRWRFASFFNRVKGAVAQQWQPGKVYRRVDPTGEIYGDASRLTIVKVWLYPDGRLKNIVIQKPCGIDALDDEAIRAFKAAAPFPNPPRRLVDSHTRLISFRFGFMLEITKGPLFKVFRYH